MTKEELLELYINKFIDEADMKTLISIVYDHMYDIYAGYSLSQLQREVKEFYPDLLDDHETD
jgi:hypothetical protein